MSPAPATLPVWADLAPVWPNQAASRFLQAGGLDWHVQVAGAGPALLLLHGTGSASFTWGGVLPRLARHFIVVAPDLPGHGFTTAPRRSVLSLPGMAGSVASLLDTLGLSPAVIVGHSAGAAVGLRLAIDRRLRPRLIVGLNPALVPPPAAYRMLLAPVVHRVATSRLAASAAATLGSSAGVVASLLRATGSTLEPDRCALYQRFFQSERHAHDVLTMMADWSLTELRADLPRVPCPVHLVAGRRDHWVPLRLLRRLSRSIPHCTFTELDGGHLHHEESPAEAAALIERAARTAGLL